MDSTADHNLLFGIFAVQLRRIDEQQLSDAHALWAERKEQSLANILVEQGWIQERDRIEIEHLLGSQVQENAGSMQETLAQNVSSEMLDEFSSALSSDVTVAMTVSSQNSEPAGPSSSPTETVDLSTVIEPLEKRERYELLRVQGEGGLGRVWVARDQSLGRIVALKEIRNTEEASSDAIARFQREAQITSRLEHPNIVPVYDWEDGESRYYTMRLVHGHTLDDAIKNYHRLKNEGKASRLKLQELLTAFLGVCQAVSYAHARGVIHRDIKPANVLLGEFGEVILLDWGLARSRGDQNETRANADPVDANSLQTQAGEIMGTPAFMAPEQARGKIEEIDHRTDLYSLGAMLFMICTGRSPHRGNSTRDVLVSIVKSEVPSARSLSPSVPRPLDAICRKSLAKKKEDRYESALRMQEDIKRWIADEPVSVYRESWWERGGRWFRRHRAMAVGTIAALAGIAVVSLAAAVLINRARLNEATAFAEKQEAHEKEQLAQAEAERRRRQARAAISRWQVDLADVMRHHPRIQVLREKLLQQAADEYDQLSPDLKTQPDALAEHVRIYLRLGDVRRRLEKSNEALTAYERAEKELRELLSLTEDEDPVWLQLAKCQGAKASAMQLAGQTQPAKTEFHRALETLKNVKSDFPESLDYVEAITEIRLRLAELLASQSQWEEAKSILNDAMQFAERNPEIRSHPTMLQLRARGRHGLSRVYSAQTQYGKAEAVLNQALSFWNDLVKTNPDDPIALEGRANAFVLRANVYRQLGKSGEELKGYQDALRDYQALHDALPDIPHYRHQVVVGHLNLAQVLHRFGMNQNAYDPASKALKSIKDLVRANPKSARFYATEAIARASFGHILRELNEWDAAATAFASATDIRSELAGKHPDQPTHALDQASSQANQGYVLGLQGNFSESKAIYLSAFTLLNDLTEKESLKSEAQFTLALAKRGYGETLWLDNKKEDAATAFQEAAVLLESLQKTPRQKYELVGLRLFCSDPKYRDPKQALPLAADLASQRRGNGQYRGIWGIALVQAGQPQRAIPVLQEATKLPDGNTPGVWFYLALAYQLSKDPQSAQTSYETGLKRMNREQPGNVFLEGLNEQVKTTLQSNMPPKSD